MMSPLSKQTLSPSELGSAENRMGLTRGQAAKCAEMIEHALLKSPIFGNSSTSAIDDFIKEAGPDIRKAFMRLFERRFKLYASEAYSIVINHDDRKSILEEIMKDGFLRRVVSAIGISNIPVRGNGIEKKELRIFRYGSQNHLGLLNLMRLRGVEDGFRNGYVFADPLSMLLLAARYPESIFIRGGLETYFFIGDQKYHLSLYNCAGKEFSFYPIYQDEMENERHTKSSCLVQPDLTS